MIFVIIILLMLLAFSICANFYLKELLQEERGRRFEAEAWIDPVELKQFYEDGGFEVLK